MFNESYFISLQYKFIIIIIVLGRYIGTTFNNIIVFHIYTNSKLKKNHYVFE